MSSAVFFETVTPLRRWLVAWYLAFGHRVFIFDFTYRLKRMAWLRKLLQEEKVRRIYIHNGSRADGLAIDAAEWLYPKVSHHPLIQRLGKLFGSPEAEPVFKHALVESLSRYFYVRLYLEQTIQMDPTISRVTLIPESFCMWDLTLKEWCRGKLQPLRGVCIPQWPRLWSAVVREGGKLFRHIPRYVGSGIALGLAWLGKRLFSHVEQKPILRYRYLFSVESQFQTQFTGERRFDFLLDHKRLTKENTAFLVGELGAGPWVEQARKAGYRIILRSSYSRPWNYLRCPPRTVEGGRVLRALLDGIRCVRAPEWMHQAAAMGLWAYLKDANLLENIHFGHYIYANQYGLLPRWRNVLIRKTGAQVWWYAYSSGGTYTRCQGGAFGSDADFGGRLRFWSYENADHFVSPCRPLIDYHRAHRQRIREYHDVGNIWSEQILRMAPSIDRNAWLRDWFGPHAKKGKVIGWFDTSFVEAPNSPSTVSEGIRWYDDIRRLLDEREDLLMVIKPSKDEAYYVDDGADQQWAVPSVGKKLMQVWQALKDHPRVCFLDRRTDPSVVIAVSDLIITFPYTSVSAEALGARKRAIWYEPGARWRGTLYAQELLLVAHGFSELQALVEKLLWNMSEEEYQGFLEKKVRGLIDSFLDGKGVSRFQALLCGEGIR